LSADNDKDAIFFSGHHLLIGRFDTIHRVSYRNLIAQRVLGFCVQPIRMTVDNLKIALLLLFSLYLTDKPSESRFDKDGLTLVLMG
jgi:hypothetical protein